MRVLPVVVAAVGTWDAPSSVAGRCGQISSEVTHDVNFAKEMHVRRSG